MTGLDKEERVEMTALQDGEKHKNKKKRDKSNFFYKYITLIGISGTSFSGGVGFGIWSSNTQVSGTTTCLLKTNNTKALTNNSSISISYPIGSDYEQIISYYEQTLKNAKEKFSSLQKNYSQLIKKINDLEEYSEYSEQERIVCEQNRQRCKNNEVVLQEKLHKCKQDIEECTQNAKALEELIYKKEKELKEEQKNCKMDTESLKDRLGTKNQYCIEGFCSALGKNELTVKGFNEDPDEISRDVYVACGIAPNSKIQLKTIVSWKGAKGTFRSAVVETKNKATARDVCRDAIREQEKDPIQSIVCR